MLALNFVWSFIVSLTGWYVIDLFVNVTRLFLPKADDLPKNPYLLKVTIEKFW